MKKIKITNQQYQKIILFEQENKLIKENDESVIMGFSKLIGVRLTNKNLEMGEKALKDSSTLIKIKDMIEQEGKLKNIVKVLEEKGMDNPSEKIKNKADDIVVKFNKISNELNLRNFLGLDATNNLKNL